jgi:histone demethylase JARID1
MSSLSTSLKNSYQRWLHPYEEWLRLAKAGVHQQLENEHGGSYSPHVPSHQSPMSHPIPPQSAPPVMSTGSPAIQPAMAPSPSIQNSLPPSQSQQPQPPPSILHPLPAPTPQQRPVSSSGFTAVNSGFAAVNNPGGFTAVNHLPPPVVKTETNGVPPITPNSASPFVSINGPTITTIHPNNPMSNGASNPLKRTMSHDSLNGESGSEGLDTELDGVNGRRSKRPKKGELPLH